MFKEKFSNDKYCKHLIFVTDFRILQLEHSKEHVLIHIIAIRLNQQNTNAEER